MLCSIEQWWSLGPGTWISIPVLLLIPVQSRAGYLPSLCLSFLICHWACQCPFDRVVERGKWGNVCKMHSTWHMGLSLSLLPLLWGHLSFEDVLFWPDAGSKWRAFCFHRRYHIIAPFVLDVPYEEGFVFIEALIRKGAEGWKSLLVTKRCSGSKIWMVPFFVCCFSPLRHMVIS